MLVLCEITHYDNLYCLLYVLMCFELAGVSKLKNTAVVAPHTVRWQMTQKADTG